MLSIQSVNQLIKIDGRYNYIKPCYIYHNLINKYSNTISVSKRGDIDDAIGVIHYNRK